MRKLRVKISKIEKKLSSHDHLCWTHECSQLVRPNTYAGDRVVQSSRPHMYMIRLQDYTEPSFHSDTGAYIPSRNDLPDTLYRHTDTDTKTEMLKTRDWKLQDHQKCKDGKLKTEKQGTKSHKCKTRDWKTGDQIAGVENACSYTCTHRPTRCRPTCIHLVFHRR